MPREYVPYAIVETTFILSDPRYKTLPPTAKVLYVALWARAFQDRRDTLPNWYDTGAMQEDSRLDARTITKAVALLLRRCLIEKLPDGRIRIVGIKGKGRIKWKEEGATEVPVGGEVSAQQMSEKRREEKRREENITELPMKGEEGGGEERPVQVGGIAQVWEAWCAAGIQDDRIVMGGLEAQAIKEALGRYGADIVLEAVEEYRRILNGSEYLLETRWTLDTFLSRHMAKFLPGSHPERMYAKRGAALTRKERMDRMLGVMA